MRLTKEFCKSLLGCLPCQQFSGSEVALTTFIPSTHCCSTTETLPESGNRGRSAERTDGVGGKGGGWLFLGVLGAVIPWDISDLSTCFCSINAISHLANGTEREMGGGSEWGGIIKRSEWETERRERKRDLIIVRTLSFSLKHDDEHLI